MVSLDFILDKSLNEFQIVEISKVNPQTKEMFIVLARDDWTIKVHPHAWARILLFLEDNGWRPEQQRTTYYAGKTDVSKIDAAAMADYGSRVLQVALNNPLKV